MEEKIKELEELCKPVSEYLKKNWNPHCTVIITDTHIKLVRDEVSIPLEIAQEVPVQEQSEIDFIQEDSNGIHLKDDSSCMFT